MKDPYQLTLAQMPGGFSYPPEFIWTIRHGIVDLVPWRFLSGELLVARSRGIRERYPARRLVPFAQRQDNDDVACWDGDAGWQVIVIHDFADSGWEARDRSHVTFLEWLDSAFDEFIEWARLEYPEAD